MKDIYTYCDEKGYSDVLRFLKDADVKVRRKLHYQIQTMLQNNVLPGEPHVKHFTIERYKAIYEFRIKAAKRIVRILFCERSDSVILLHAFYKRDKKDTKQALDYTLKLLQQFNESNLLPFEDLRKVILN